MTVRAWRTALETHAEDAFTGEGARLYGGRWNSAGVAVVYTAGSRSLAALELLVHLDSPRLLRRFVLIEVEFDEALAREPGPGEIPVDWRAEPPPRSTQAVGDLWVKEAGSAVLRVPSAVIAEEFNYLLNLAHADFGRVRMGEARAFRFDPRLSKG